jgi:thiol-disulfide isomerase/thioredoxin
LKSFASRMLQRAFVAVFLAWTCAAQAAGFDVTDTLGHHHRLADYHGRWVVLNFWATWCGPCVQEIPEVAAFARAHPDVIVIGIAMDSADADLVKRFAASHGHAYPLVIADDAVERQMGSMAALPVTRIYDPEGRVAYDRVGRIDRRVLEFATRDRGPARAQAAGALPGA